MTENPHDFESRRARGNERVLEGAPLAIRRFFALDHDVYDDGVLPKKTKDLLGLTASTVLRCNDCIAHHLKEATASGGTREEIAEALGIALLVGGSITIPHLRFAFEFLEELA
jgi:ribonuclease HI